MADQIPNTEVKTAPQDLTNVVAYHVHNSVDAPRVNYTDLLSLPNMSVYATTASVTSLTTDFANAYFGDGTDGDVTISADTDLTRDMYYSNLTINNTKYLNTKGFKIFVSGTLTNNGHIDNSGTNASGHAKGTGGITGSLRGGTDGGEGQISNTGSGIEIGGGGGGGGGTIFIAAKKFTNSGVVHAQGGNGANGYAGTDSTAAATAGGDIDCGKGGSGGNGGGGTAGGVVTQTGCGLKTYSEGIICFDSGKQKGIGGGAGGGGGTAQYTVKANGGGGGGGGLIIVFYYEASVAGSLNVTAGTGGTGTGVGSAPGSTGSNGAYIYQKI